MFCSSIRFFHKKIIVLMNILFLVFQLQAHLVSYKRSHTSVNIYCLLLLTISTWFLMLFLWFLLSFKPTAFCLRWVKYKSVTLNHYCSEHEHRNKFNNLVKAFLKFHEKYRNQKNLTLKYLNKQLQQNKWYRLQWISNVYYMNGSVVSASTITKRRRVNV